MEGEFYQDGISVNIVNRNATEQTYRKIYGNFALKTIQIYHPQKHRINVFKI